MVVRDILQGIANALGKIVLSDSCHEVNFKQVVEEPVLKVGLDPENQPRRKRTVKSMCLERDRECRVLVTNFTKESTTRESHRNNAGGKTVTCD